MSGSGDAPSVELSEKPAAAAVDDVTCDVDLAAEPAKTDAEEAEGDAAREAEPTKEELSWIEKKGLQFENWMNEDWDHVPLYWEPEYEGPPPEQLGLKGRSWHRFRHVVNKTLSGVEFVGEVTVNILGLNESKYQWVIDALEVTVNILGLNESKYQWVID